MTSRQEPHSDLSRKPYGLAARLVWAVAALGLVAIGLVTWLGFQAGESGQTFVSVVAALQLLIAVAAFLLSGAVIVSRQPRNIIGWLLIIPGLAVPLSEMGRHWLVALDPVPVTVDPGLWLVMWFIGWSWVLLIFPILHLLLTFPNGQLLSPRWRWAVGLEVVMVGTLLGAIAFSNELQVLVEDTTLWAVPNPIGFLSEAAVEGFFGSVWGAALLVMTLTSASAVILRFRSGSHEEREQLKWPLCAIATFGAVYGFGAWTSGFVSGSLADFLFGLSVVGIPISIAIAVLRYRLYEIDRILSRTVSYALVIGLLAAMFFGIVSLLTLVIPSESNLVTAGSTLAVAALFNPLRKRVQSLVDRRFNRSRYDTQMVMDGFAASLRDRVDPEEVVTGWTNVVAETMQPAAIGTWLRTR
ncbi:MAG: hypothetical protein WEE53_11595 [Acidimicrobiia bacterium]